MHRAYRYRCFGIKRYWQCLLKGCTDTEALLSLGVLSGTVSNEEYEEVTGTEDSRSKLRADEGIRRKIAEKKASSLVERKAPVKVVDYVYRKMLELDQFRLSPEGYLYLKNRNLSDEEISEAGYFSYNDKFSVNELLNVISQDKYRKPLKELDEKLKKDLYDSLWGIPGFYYQYTDKKKMSGVWKFVHPTPECVGIPIKNGNGLISALQMRQMKDTEGGNFTYCFVNCSTSQITWEFVKTFIERIIHDVFIICRFMTQTFHIALLIKTSFYRRNIIPFLQTYIYKIIYSFTIQSYCFFEDMIKIFNFSLYVENIFILQYPFTDYLVF